MWDECERFTESIARTDKLKCSDCSKKINKGESVTFKIDTETERMKDVYCSGCIKDYEHECVCDTQHPFDLE